MKNDTFHLEILLVAASAFFKRQLFKRNMANDSSHHLSTQEQMVEACWQVFLSEMFPEVIRELSLSGRRLYIWHINRHAFSLQIKMNEIPLVAGESSIDPDYFLAQLSYN